MKLTILFLTIAFLSISTFSFSQEITMFPGFFGVKYYQDDTKISKSKMKSLMRKDSEANQLWSKSKKHAMIGYVALGVEIGLLYWRINRGDNFDNQTGPLIGAIVSGAAAMGFLLSANNLRKNSILKYNENLDVGSLRFGPTNNGIGLVYSFN